MRPLLILAWTLGLGLFTGNPGISMSGISINDSFKVLGNLKLKVIASDKTDSSQMIKFRTKNGNDFSVTTRNGKVVFMENDWSQKKKGKTPLLTGFIFGETTVKQIISTFGTKGFFYKNHSHFTDDVEITEFYCFELDSPGNEILCLVAKAQLSNKDMNLFNTEKFLLLDAVILADRAYLDEIWGKEKLYSDRMKKISL